MSTPNQPEVKVTEADFALATAIFNDGASSCACASTGGDGWEVETHRWPKRIASHRQQAVAAETAELRQQGEQNELMLKAAFSREYAFVEQIKDLEAKLAAAAKDTERLKSALETDQSELGEVYSELHEVATTTAMEMGEPSPRINHRMQSVRHTIEQGRAALSASPAEKEGM